MSSTKAGKLVTYFIALIMCVFVSAAFTPTDVYAKAKFGGKMFKSSPTKSSPSKQYNPAQGQKGSFAKSMAGGLLGGALGAMLFGSLLGGQGLGILPMLLLAGAAYFIFRKMTSANSRTNRAPNPPPFTQSGNTAPPSYPTDFGNEDTAGSVPVDQGLAQIKATDPGFDEGYFTEVASDVFFKVQAGWMRQEIDGFRNLLGDTLAAEYEKHFEDMKAKGIVNKLESIAVRGVEIVDAGSDGQEDFITVRFTASLLDYTVETATGKIIEGSDSSPIKFDERWTWARPVRTENWKLEGIHGDE